MGRTTRRPQRTGTTTVEFALTAPILFFLLTGAIELSRANMLRHTAVVAATEGARRSIIPGATAAECAAAATSELNAVGFRTADVLIDPAVIGENTSQVSVSVSIPLSGDNGFVLPAFLKGAKISRTVTLQRELAIENPNSENSAANLKGN
ncbi:MAG: TadE family protein [Planctomycetota bacterium]